MAECNEIIMLNIKLMINMKAAMQLLKKRYLRIIFDINLDHAKCTHLPPHA